MSLSQTDNSLLEQEPVCNSQFKELPSAVLATVEAMNLGDVVYTNCEEQNSNGCKLLVKKDAMLDSLDARERSYDNSANGINLRLER